ncbi:MAG: heme lyase CcmF/NrfE family subunit, partial [Candidatus Bathyarchaeia archaeon]
MIGYISLILALALTSIGLAAYIAAIKKNLKRYFDVGRWSTTAVFLFMTVAVIWLFYLFLARDFQTAYVAYHSSRDLPLVYTISGFWAGQQGSLLLWGWLVSAFTTITAVTHKKRDRLNASSTSILLIITLFFLVVLTAASNPFEKLPFVPPDGAGLNPLLQDIGMVIHPPITFLGYAGFSVPFAFGISGLMLNREDWIYHVRKWVLFSWIFLSLGIGLGGWWSYHVLGWGGYWAWDPVENASLMPWLMATAFLHSVMIQEGKRGMKTWNALLISFTFILVLYATLLTRSGILQSVHAFGQSPITPYFTTFMLLTLFASLWLVINRLPRLRGKNIFEAYVSRETSFLFNNLIFVVGALIIFLGTSYPLLSEAIRGFQVSVGPGYFNQTAVPLAVVLLLLMGVCQVIPWRRASAAVLKDRLKYPAVIVAVVIVAAVILGVRDGGGVLVVGVSSLVLATHAFEFHRGAKVEQNSSSIGYLRSLARAVKKNRRRYGGYVVHISMIIIAVGIGFSYLYESSRMFTVSPGEPYVIGDYTLALDGFRVEDGEKRAVYVAAVSVYKGGVKVDDASPSL